jgi:hypothetical protein
LSVDKDAGLITDEGFPMKHAADWSICFKPLTHDIAAAFYELIKFEHRINHL